uniref:Uncharacterized protein n=1 Tax=Caenorhabditis japonica TaxID=281687 RepID=A0A8R1HL70_CAEJA
MIPEFPLPTVDADFYKSQLCQLPPIFECIRTAPIFDMEPVSFLSQVDRSIAANSLTSNCLENAVKRATIQQRIQLAKNTNFAATKKSLLMPTLGSLTSMMTPLVVTQ